MIDEEVISEAARLLSSHGYESDFTARLLAIAERSRWRPIDHPDTPRDGRYVLVCCAVDDTIDPGLFFSVAEWSEAYAMWMPRNDGIGEPCEVDPAPTHWRHMPDMPARSKR